MSALIHDLGAREPGLLLAVGIIVGAIVVILWVAICGAWDRANDRLDSLMADAPSIPAPRTSSESDRYHGSDAWGR